MCEIALTGRAPKVTHDSFYKEPKGLDPETRDMRSSDVSQVEYPRTGRVIQIE